MGEKDKASDLLATLGDFTSKENWDNFFKIRGSDDAFEWYAEWEQLRTPLLSYLESLESDERFKMQILVPGCGNSKLSEYLYDEGFKSIVNVDFSKVVISDMLKRNIRVRPEMKWRVMDMTCMQFEDGAFDAVVDKGGLDALMEPELGPKLGEQYLSEVKRVLKPKGRFICLTLAESHVIGLLFSKFRFGWDVGIHIIPQKPSDNPNLQTFVLVAEKQTSDLPKLIIPSFKPFSLDCTATQARGVCEALETENKIRMRYVTDSVIVYALEDLKLGVRGDLMELLPGRRILLTLGNRYRAVLLDAQEQSDQNLFHCAVFLVPKTRTNEWLFSSEEGQWKIVESCKAERLIMVLLDSSHFNATMDEIQDDLSPLVKQLAPKSDKEGAKIPYMTASDGIKNRKVLYQITSTLTGSIVVEDVTYDDTNNCPIPSNELMFRILTFQRTVNLVQSEALLTKQPSTEATGAERRRLTSSSKSKKKGSSRQKNEPSNSLKVYHGYLASAYHIGIISGLSLISSHLEILSSTKRTVEAVVVGLGAGLLPMFLKGCMPSLHIKAVELDPSILDLAKKYFGFVEDDCMEVFGKLIKNVHIANGIQFIEEVAAKRTLASSMKEKKELLKASTRADENVNFQKDSSDIYKIDVLIIDVDSSDSSSGLACPAADFVEPSFLSTAKMCLSDHGLLAVNLVTRSATVRENIISRMKKVFTRLYSLQLEEDVNEVLFGVHMEESLPEGEFLEATMRLEKLLNIERPEMLQKVIESAKNIRCLH